MNRHSRSILGPALAALVLGLPVVATLTACGGDKKEDTKKEEPVEVLDKASNGSPVSVAFVAFVGDGEGRGMKIKLYNHGDKTAVAYNFLFRYFDEAGQPLKVKPGTPFEDDTDFTSMSGNRYRCEPGKNASFEVDGMIVAVPANAAKVEILASQVRSLAADGNTIEDWWSQENWSEWPAG